MEQEEGKVRVMSRQERNDYDGVTIEEGSNRDDEQSKTDFGYRGVAFFAAVYGCLCGFLYRLFRNGNGAGTCLYTYAVYVLLLQFYQENVFLSMVFVLQFAFFIVLLTQQKIRFQLSLPKP